MDFRNDGNVNEDVLYSVGGVDVMGFLDEAIEP